MATKTHPYGTNLSYSANGSTYTDLTDIVSIDPPNISVGESETTVIDSTGAYKEFIPSWAEAGELSFTCRFAKAQYNTLVGFLRAVYYWKITFPLISGETTASTLVGQGFITEIGITEGSAESDDVYDVEVTIRYTGAVTFTAGS